MSWECKHSFGLFLLGSESPFWRKLLLDNEAPHVGVNFKDLLARMNAQRTWSAQEHFSGATEVFVNAGSYGGKNKEEPLTVDEFADHYATWVNENIDRLTLVAEFDPAGASPEWIQRRRDDFWSTVAPEKFLPIWHEEDGPKALEALADHYPRVAIVRPSASVEGRLRGIVARTGVKLHGLGITGPDDVASLPIVTGSSTSWISPTHYGDSHIWAGGRFHWYPKRSSETARQRHRVDIEQAGFDVERVIAQDRKEVARYTIWAWKSYEASVAEHRQRPLANIVDIKAGVGNKTNSDEEGGSVDKPSPVVPAAQLVIRPQDKSFPGLAMRSQEVTAASEDGKTPAERVLVPVASNETLRQCSSCYIGERCPEYNPGSSCAYNFAVEVRNRPQLDASLSLALEKQLQRVTFALAAEQADGSAINKDTSAELAQYIHMVKEVREIQSDPSFFRIEARGAQAGGLLTKLLGQARGEQAAAQAQAIDPLRAEEALSRIIDVNVTGRNDE